MMCTLNQTMTTAKEIIMVLLKELKDCKDKIDNLTSNTDFLLIKEEPHEESDEVSNVEDDYSENDFSSKLTVKTEVIKEECEDQLINDLNLLSENDNEDNGQFDEDEVILDDEESEEKYDEERR